MFWFDQVWGLMPQLSRKKAENYRNLAEYRNVYMQLLNLALSSFEWKNLPETCNERWLEISLLTSGMAGFADDPERGLVALRASASSGTYNIYGEPSKIRLYGFNGYNREFVCYMQGSDNSQAKAVICRDNPTVYPYISYINTYALRISDLLRSIDVATRKLKIPYFIQADQSQAPAIEQLLNDIDDNVDKVITANATDPEAFKVWPTRIDPGVLKAMWESLDNIDGRIREILGITSAPNQDKKERLIKDEVNSNNMFTDANIQQRLRQRQIFAETVNSHFGLNISVELADHLQRTAADVNETGEVATDDVV